VETKNLSPNRRQEVRRTSVGGDVKVSLLPTLQENNRKRFLQIRTTQRAAVWGGPSQERLPTRRGPIEHRNNNREGERSYRGVGLSVGFEKSALLRDSGRGLEAKKFCKPRRVQRRIPEEGRTRMRDGDKGGGGDHDQKNNHIQTIDDAGGKAGIVELRSDSQDINLVSSPR